MSKLPVAQTPMDREAWWARVPRVTKSQIQMSWLSSHAGRLFESSQVFHLVIDTYNLKLCKLFKSIASPLMEFKDLFSLPGLWTQLFNGCSLEAIFLHIHQPWWVSGSPVFNPKSKANYVLLWWKKSLLLISLWIFYKNLVKCCAPCGYLINSWTVTDYSNWISLKLIILSWSFFLRFDNKASLLQFVFGCCIHA